MNSTKRLAATVAGAAAIAMLVGTSAFAEARHHDGTGHSQQSDHHSNNNSGSHDRSSNNHQSQTNTRTYERRDYRGSAPAQTYRGTTTQTWDRRDTRNFDRNNTQFDRRTTQPESFRNDRSWDNNRSVDRSQTFRNNNGSFDRSQTFRSNRPAFDSRGRRGDFERGRISRFEHEHGGFRVWIDGGRFPIWIPEARIGLFPHLRIGLSLGFGGYYDPLGYLEAYDYYDGASPYYAGASPYYAGVGVYNSGANSAGILRGVVETVDYRRGTLVLRDEVSGNFVTTIIRDRRLEDLRPGDYAEISGDWTRNGVFEGLRLEDERGQY